MAKNSLENTDLPDRVITVKEKSKITKTSNYDKGFWLQYNKFIREDFLSKSWHIVKGARDYKPKDFNLVRTVYDDAVSQVIGSLLATLIYKGAKEPEDYTANRYSYLKEVADLIKKEKAYLELFSFVKAHLSQGVNLISTSMRGTPPPLVPDGFCC